MKSYVKHLSVLTAVSLLASGPLMAKTVDTSAQEKDMRIMRGILESSLKEAKEDFPGRPTIKTTYLADQGYLFSVRLNGIGSLGIPGLASWGDGRLELDIPEIIEGALEAVEFTETMAPIAEIEALSEANIDISDSVYTVMSEQAQEYQERLKELREQQRELRRDIFEQSRDVRRENDANKRSNYERLLAETKKALEENKSRYDDMLKKYRSERQTKSINRSNKAVDAIMQTICDYGQTLRALDDDEKFNLLVMGAVTPEGETADQMFIFSQEDVVNCQSIDRLKKNSLYYTL